MQNEVGESANPAVKGAARRRLCRTSGIPQRVRSRWRRRIACRGWWASFLSAMVQEHERGVGGLQAEWPVLAAVVQSTGVAIASMAEVAEGLSVDAERMRANIAITNGAIFAERAMMLPGSEGRPRCRS